MKKHSKQNHSVTLSGPVKCRGEQKEKGGKVTVSTPVRNWLERRKRIADNESA